MKRIVATYILFTLCVVGAMAQADRQYIRQGNRLYRHQQPDKAEVDYLKATEANDKNPQAVYNLGCAYMQQEKDSAAIVQFEKAGRMETNRLRRAKAYHNIGVICQAHQMFPEAIDAYKEALRNNPKDDETRYNLALCQRQLKDQDNDQNQDQQDQDQQDQNQDQQQQQQQQQDKNQDQQQQQQQQQPEEQMSRENAEQLLESAMRDEKDIQEKMQQQQQQHNNRRLEKNW